jgi:hypothetical protein
MNYTKPEVVVLGTAHSVIEHATGKVGTGSDTSNPTGFQNPAYDLDE